jgi:hypothetical protein
MRILHVGRAWSVGGTIVDDAGKPIDGVKINPNIEFKFDDSMTFCARAETDESGRFHFPAQFKDFQLVIAHVRARNSRPRANRPPDHVHGG